VSITLLKPREVAEKLRISVRQVYTMIRRGDLTGVRFAGTVRVDASSLDELIEAGRTQPKGRACT
jgi:excisionase family DNA binding protein